MMIKKLILTVVILAALAFAIFYFARNIIVERAIEEGGDYALGVDTDLGSANLGLSAGSLDLSDYEISNPEGFESEYFFRIDKGILDISTGSVFDDEIIVDSLILDGIFMNFEQIDGKGNFSEIMNNLRRIEMGESSDSDLKMSIKKVSVKNINVIGTLSLLGKEQYSKSFKVDNIALSNVGGDGESIAEVTAKIFSELINKAKLSATKILPDFGAELDKLKEDAKDKLEDEAKDKIEGKVKSLLGN